MALGYREISSNMTCPSASGNAALPDLEAAIEKAQGPSQVAEM